MLDNGYYLFCIFIGKVSLSKLAHVLQLIFAGKFVPKFYLILPVSLLMKKAKEDAPNIHFLSPVCLKDNL